MKTLSLIIVLIVPTCLNAQQPLSDNAREIKTEVREFRPSEIRDIKFDLYDGGLSFTAKNVTYTYQSNLESSTEKIAVGATLLSEMRHATKLLVRVQLPAGDHVYSQFFVLQFDSPEGSSAPLPIPYSSADATRTVLPPGEPSQNEPKSIVINVAADGSLSIAREQFNLSGISAELKKFGTLQPKPSIIIRAEKGIDYKHVTDVLDACMTAGLDSIAFATATPK